MNTTNIKLRNVVIASTAIVILLQFFAIILAFVKYTPSNVVFYGITVYFTMRNLFSQKPHHIFAFMWSLLTAYLLGWFFGAIEIILYWLLYFIKVKYMPSATPTSGATPTSSATVQSGVIKRYGRLPFVRIPLPWLKYTLDLDLGVLTRDCLFPEKRDKDNPKRDLLGKDDDLLLNQVFDWSFSTKLWRKLAGTSCFEFQSKKIGKSGDKKTHWHCLPDSMIKPLRGKLIQVNHETK